jgi:hypothetical protein
LNLGGGSRFGLPKLKSNTFSAPYFAFLAIPSSNIFLIQDDFSMDAWIFFDTDMGLPPSIPAHTITVLETVVKEFGEKAFGPIHARSSERGTLAFSS